MLFSIKYTTWDRRKCSLFRVEGCSPKTNRVISPIVKYTEKMGPGKVFTIKGCSLIRGFTMRGFTVQLLLHIPTVCVRAYARACVRACLPRNVG